jgi:hypothetical protein
VLPMLVYTYNTTRHSSTKMTPFQVHRRRDEVFKMDRFVKANLEKTAQEMIRRFAKLPSKKVRPKREAEPLEVGDDVRISTQSQIEVRKDGDIKIKSKLKKRLLTGFTKETYTILSISTKEDGAVLHTLSGEHRRNYYLRNELQKVNLEGLIKVGENKREDLNFGQGGFDLEGHLQGLSVNEQKESEMTQEELETRYPPLTMKQERNIRHPHEGKHDSDSEEEVSPRRSDRVRNKPAGPEVIPKKKVNKLISDQNIEEEDAKNLVDEVKLQNTLKDKRPVGQSALREGLRSKDKLTDEQMAQNLHANLNKHKSVAQVAKAIAKPKKKK